MPGTVPGALVKLPYFLLSTTRTGGMVIVLLRKLRHECFSNSLKVMPWGRGVEPRRQFLSSVGRALVSSLLSTALWTSLQGTLGVFKSSPPWRQGTERRGEALQRPQSVSGAFPSPAVCVSYTLWSVKGCTLSLLSSQPHPEASPPPCSQPPASGEGTSPPDLLCAQANAGAPQR